MKHIIIQLVLIILANANAQGSTVETHYSINSKRDALNINLVNRSNSDVLCEKLNVTIQVAMDAFGSSRGGFSTTESFLYLTSESNINFDDYGKDKVLSYRDENNLALISTATVETVGCGKATFADYCQYANKSESEIYTIDRLVTAAGTENCSDIEAKLNGSLDLSEKGITTLKPILYLESLKKLVLNKNNITDVGDLKNLSNLKFLDISDNPIVNIDEVVALPNIERIKANYTLIEYKKFPKISSTLKKLEIRGTPLEGEMKKRRN